MAQWMWLIYILLLWDEHHHAKIFKGFVLPGEEHDRTSAELGNPVRSSGTSVAVINR